MADSLTAAAFEARLRALQSDEELRKIQGYFKSGEGQYGEGDVFIGVRMGQLFDLAKQFAAMELSEIETLLDSPVHELRAGAMSIMAKQYALKATGEERRQALFDLYLRRHDRINNWDIVDLGAPYVLGRHLLNRPRDVLYALARSGSLWERRSAMFATLPLVKAGQQDDAYALADILLHDPEDLIHKVVGGMLRQCGVTDRPRLKAFLAPRAAGMPRVALRYAIEHFPPEERARLLAMKG